MKQAFLLLSRPDRAGDYTVRLAGALSGAVSGWRASTRMSPIYIPRLRADDELPTEDFVGAHVLLFVGPTHPGAITDRLPAGCEAWLTLGAFNVLVHAPSDRAAELDAWAQTGGLRYECWTIRDGARIGVSYSTAPAAIDPSLQAVVHLANAPRPAVLDDSVKEFTPLIASALTRANDVYPAVVDTLVSLCAFAREDLRDAQRNEATEEDHYALLGQMTMVNAALSRFTSQAFSGATPLTDTESHFWTHSLLGTGVANIALWRFCNFIFARVGEARLPQRLEALADHRIDVDGRLENLAERADWWERDDLGRLTLPPDEASRPLSPIITCFSGRDGYKSTLQTLSAPLAVIGACNSLRWTLLTLTHEVSHIIVRGAMGVLYPRLTADQITEASDLLEREPDTMLDAARRYLLLGVLAMHQVDQGNAPVDTTARAMPAILNRWQREVEELMVHVFDFLYFYGGDPEKYVRGIWLSWSVIPNIGHRIPEYVLRSLCAVVSLHLRRGTEVETTARDQVRAALVGLQRDGHASQYVNEALGYLEDHWEDLRMRLFARRLLIRIVRKYLYSPTIAATLREESEIGGGAAGRDGYSLRVGEFDETPVANPLRFVETYTQAANPSVLHSMWMLTTLAFNLPTQSNGARAVRDVEAAAANYEGTSTAARGDPLRPADTGRREPTR